MAQPPLPLVTDKTRRTIRLKSGAAHKARPLGPKNRQALELLQAWMSTSDDKGAEWWDDFERELARQRPTFRVT